MTATLSATPSLDGHFCPVGLDTYTSTRRAGSGSRVLILTKKSLGLTNNLFLVVQCFSGWQSSKSNLRIRFGTSFEISMKAMFRPKQVRDPRPYYAKSWIVSNEELQKDSP